MKNIAAIYPQVVLIIVLSVTMTLHVLFRGDRLERPVYDPVYIGIRIVMLVVILYLGGFWNALGL